MSCLQFSSLAACVALAVVEFGSLSASAAESPKPQVATAKPTRRRPPPIAIQSDFRLARLSKNAFRLPKEAPVVKNCHQLVLGVGQFPNAQGAPSQFQLLCYNGEPVGPTFTVKRGKKFCIHVTNTLNSIGPSPPPNPPLFPPSKLAEAPHGLCITNLHTHGLHVSPDGNSDNVFQHIQAAQDLTFEFSLDGCHPAGTFWYHPHNHGSVAYQLSNGLAGALLVEGSPHDEWHKTGHYDLEDIPEIKAASEYPHQKPMVFQLYNYRVGSDATPTGRIDTGLIYNIQPDASNCDAIQLTSATPPATGQLTTINGVINPVIQMAPGEVQRWRLIHAGWDLDRCFTLVNDYDVPTSDLKFIEIAVDGLATGKLEEKPAIELAPGQRSDVLIRVPPDVPPNTIYHLKQIGVPGPAAPHSDPQQELWLAKIQITGPAVNMHLPNEYEPHVRDKLQKCRPFKDIEDAELTPPPGAQDLTLKFSACDAGPTDGCGTVPFYTINGKTFTRQQPLSIPINTAQEWVVTATKDNHPFHIHVNPFQIVSYRNACGVVRRINLWRDTLYIKESEQYTIRSRFRDYVGDSVLHCHILDHEDQGMMMCLRFYDPTGKLKPVGPGCPPLQQLNALNTPAPTLRLPDAKGRVAALRDFRGRNVVLVFFLGADCPHCTQSLRDILAQARQKDWGDTAIVAVSSEPIRDLARAQSILGYLPSDLFYLLVDEPLNAFRAFGCSLKGEPQHGLFVIDRNGTIRARYSGPSPFEPATAVLDAIRKIPSDSRHELTVQSPSRKR
jgi:FtsP/CotA-like multicopper oxidase with cupredoxin domain/peroxiredoxin